VENLETVMTRSDEVYDLRGLRCPLPVLKTRKKMQALGAGQRLWVETTDPLAVLDIPHFCEESGHWLIETIGLPAGKGHRFLIEKGGKARDVS
jgi:tRNA 2-thiouridine synthesizing protein A